MRLLLRMERDCVAYREAAEGIFSPHIRSQNDLRRCFQRILIQTEALHLGLLQLEERLPELYRQAIDYKNDPLDAKWREERDARAAAEHVYRHQFESALRASPHWRHFRPQNWGFPEDVGLSVPSDYDFRLRLHVPEIYGCTFKVEDRARRFRVNHSEAALTDLQVEAQHLGRFHIEYLLQALSWATEEGSWDDDILVWNVSAAEVDEVLAQPHVIVPGEPVCGHPRWKLLGRTNRKRYVLIVFTVREDQFRLIAAYPMNPKEKKLYAPSIKAVAARFTRER